MLFLGSADWYGQWEVGDYRFRSLYYIHINYYNRYVYIPKGSALSSRSFRESPAIIYIKYYSIIFLKIF